jgi:hypothetical protein
MNEARKLYRVQLKGMKGSFIGTCYGMPIGTCYGMPYVVATNPTDAYKIVQEYLDKTNLGFRSEREMDSITLLAEEGDYPDCRFQLFIAEASHE